jgi:hypothetical protein
MDTLPAKLKKMFITHRDSSSKIGHGRIPETAAWLYIGLVMGLEYAVSIGSISEEAKLDIQEDGSNVILTASNNQQTRISEDRPAARFVEILSEIITAGRVDIKKILQQTVAFDDIAKSTSHDEPEHLSSKFSEFIGWYDEDFYYLLSGQTYRAITGFCREQGSRFPITENSLWKALDAEGLIKTEITGNDRRRHVQKNIEGKKHRVIALRRDSLSIFLDTT